MTNSAGECVRYPLLESLLVPKELSLKGIYTIRDTAQIFDVSPRTLQDWIRDGKLIARQLPGRGRFLSEDLELFLQRSVRRGDEVREKANSSDEGAREGGQIPGRQRERRQYGK